MTEAECCIFMLFFLLRMLSEDWYTWMLENEERRVRGETLSAQLTSVTSWLAQAGSET